MKKSDALIINFSRNSLKYIFVITVLVMWNFYKNDLPSFDKLTSAHYYLSLFLVDLLFVLVSFSPLPVWIIEKKVFKPEFVDKMLVVMYLYYCLLCCWSRGLYRLVLEKQECFSMMKNVPKSVSPITNKPPSKFGQFIIDGNGKCWKDEKNQYWVFKKNVVPESSHWSVVNQDGKKIMKVSVGGKVL